MEKQRVVQILQGKECKEFFSAVLYYILSFVPAGKLTTRGQIANYLEKMMNIPFVNFKGYDIRYRTGEMGHNIFKSSISQIDKRRGDARGRYN